MERGFIRMFMLKRFVYSLAGGVALMLACSSAYAMPNFSRKLGVPCSTCHSTIPRLNETGYKFRAAGFRMPEEIGKSDEKKFELGDFFAARAQARYDTQATNQP